MPGRKRVERAGAEAARGVPGEALTEGPRPSPSRVIVGQKKADFELSPKKALLTP
jgi:hypothetical protein